MTTATTTGGWVAIVLAAWLILAPLAAIAWGRFIRFSNRDFDSDHRGRTRVGLDSPLTDLTAEREARIQRARWRHQRHGKDHAA